MNEFEIPDSKFQIPDWFPVSLKSGPIADGDIALDPSKPGDFSEKELNEIKKLVVEHKTILLKQLDLFYDHIPVKAIRK
jgi:hypothetical protein